MKPGLVNTIFGEIMDMKSTIIHLASSNHEVYEDWSDHFDIYQDENGYDVSWSGQAGENVSVQAKFIGTVNLSWPLDGKFGWDFEEAQNETV